MATLATVNEQATVIIRQAVNWLVQGGSVETDHVAGVDLGNVFRNEIEDSAGRGDNDMDGLVESENVISQVGTAGGGQNLDAAVLAHFDADLRSLEGQFTRRNENQSLHFVAVWVNSETLLR